MTDRPISRQQKHRLKRRAEGKCGREGCPHLSGNDYYCVACVEAERARSRANYQARKLRDIPTPGGVY